ncbi:hypothetical protein Sdia_25840 [Streptomyces diastaticus subsp. diastaticus]|uniref:Uncharacterized protein n=1 Tax=Streptomyces diastaticus subsp. diastaticus TaxID=68040 RepID=A0ABQ1CP25_STRDI|nr:hypothetical protein Sdia_25840 [Streptomyces diastaticus subsp. diastaticus]GGU41494.1 hypothetical protein GCM10015534_50370 [Streptomyces diastaticus subsp. diastaticus]
MPERAPVGQAGRRFAVFRRGDAGAVRAHGPVPGRRRAQTPDSPSAENPAARTTGKRTAQPDTRTVPVANAEGRHPGARRPSASRLPLRGERR